MSVTKYKETEENKVLVEKEYFFGNAYRLKRFAVHYLLDIIQSEYREKGYRTEQINGGAINCYKSELKKENKRKSIEWTICVKKI
jgi:ethanolamine utilization protein EutA (predicted chaperonin)